MTYDFWHLALAGEEVGGPKLPVNDGECHEGFWRKRTAQAGPFVPVATWEQDGQMVALVNGKPADPAEIWTYICRHPVSEEHYHERLEKGRWWDEDEAVVASRGNLTHDASTNNPPATPLEDLTDQIETALKGVDAYAKIVSDEEASKAQSLRSRLLDLSGDAEKKRVKEKQPHLDAGRAVDDAWNPLVRTAKAGADKLRAAMSAYETEQKRLRDAAEAKAAAEKAAREKAAADALKAAQAAGEPAPAVTPPPEPEPVPEPPKAASMQIRGGSGRAASKQMVKIATVVDIDKAFQSLKTHPELVALISTLAQRAVKAGFPVDGVSVEEKVDVR